MQVEQMPPALPPRPTGILCVKSPNADLDSRNGILNMIEAYEPDIMRPPALPPRPTQPAPTNQQQQVTKEYLSELITDFLPRALQQQAPEAEQAPNPPPTSLLYTLLPIDPTSQIRILELLPGALPSPIHCNLIVQDIDLTTPRHPPPTQHRDLIGDLFHAPGVISYFRRNVTKQDFKRDLTQWLPQSYRDRAQEKFIAAHAQSSALPAFNALSYTWGKPDDGVETISVHVATAEDDGGAVQVEVEVTRNLFGALRRLRRSEEDGMLIPLWVDQICINQGDEWEKSVQVGRMGRIYSLAWDVVVWLGDVDEEEEEEDDDDEDHEVAKKQAPLDNRARRRQTAEVLLRVMENAQTTWWTRTWCIQEFMMARQDPLACFGDRQMRWTEMTRLGKQVRDDRELRWKSFKEDWKGESDAARIENEPVESVSNPFFSFQRIKYMANGPRTLASMGWAYSQTEATDPRDKVYSLLGIIDPAESALIGVDYSKPVPWVFAEATHASIQASGNLHILQLVRTDKSDLELPSWCVDFSYAGKAIKQDWTTTGDFSQYLFDTTDDGGGTNAAATPASNVIMPWTQRHQCTTAKASLSVQRKLLVVRGLEFDVVVKTIRSRTRKEYWDGLVGGAKDLLKAPLSLFSNQPIMLTKDEKAVFQFVVDAVGAKGSPFEQLGQRPGSEPLSDVASQFSFETDTSEDGADRVSMFSFRLFDVWSRRYLRGHASGFLTKVAWRQYGLWKLYFRHLCHGDTFFTTRSGFMGLGHADCRAGDIVVLPYGSRHPVLLRSDGVGGRYSFLGFSYVNGIMNYELRRMVPGLGLQERDFVLR